MITDKDCVQPETYEYKGLSTDEKPTNCGINSLFLELDTGDFYFFNGTEWGKINSTIQLGEDPTGTIQITNNGIFDVHNYAEADVDVPAINPTGAISITENGTYDVANYAEANVGVDVTVNFDLPALAKTTPTELSEARPNLAATSVGNYALFGGGASARSTVDAYNTSLTRTTPTALSTGRRWLAATTVGDYALFGGGYSSNYYATVDAYNTSLTRTTPTELSIARCDLAATTVGNYALFGGGAAYYTSDTTKVDAYDNSLTRTTPTELSQGLRANLAAATVGNYALFGGGGRNATNATYYATVDSYNTSLTRTTPTVLSAGRTFLAATTVGDYALFGGGYSYSSGVGAYYYATVDAYNTSLTRSTPTELSQARSYLAATSVGNYALFGGGYDENYVSSSTVDVYDTLLTRTISTSLSQARRQLAATEVGNYALFGGGYDYSNVVDAYSPYHDIQVFPGTKYSFNGSTEQTSSTWQTITMQGEVVGYIKVKDATVN